MRRAAVQLLESRLVGGERGVTEAVEALAADPDARVATQVFLAIRTAGKTGGSEVPAALRSTARPLPLVDLLRERDRKESLMQLSESGRKGKGVYESLCIACHGPDGQGVPSADRLLGPPLTKSRWFADGGHVPVLARILLKGETGPGYSFQVLARRSSSLWAFRYYPSRSLRINEKIRLTTSSSRSATGFSRTGQLLHIYLQFFFRNSAMIAGQTIRKFRSQLQVRAVHF